MQRAARGSDHDSSFPDERRAKRQKLEPQWNSQNSPHIVDESDDADQLMTDDFVDIRHVSAAPQDAKALETKPFVGRGSSKPTAQNGTWSVGVKEFKNLQKSMDSSLPNHKKRRNMEKRIARGNSGTPRSSLASSRSDPIELLDSRMVVRPAVTIPYQGIVDSYASEHNQVVIGREARRSTAERSPHFPIPNAAASPEERELVTASVNDEPASTESRLRDQYRDTDGRKRNSMDHSSSDELVTAESNTRALSPVKTARSQTPVQIPQHDSPGSCLVEDDSNNLEQIQSNIRPSTFTNAGKTPTRPKTRKHPSNNLEESSAPWSIPIAAYSLQGLRHRSDSLGLVYNEKAKAYEIHQSGQNLARSNPELRIQPTKLQRIVWELEGTKMRFQSSKTGNFDPVLDIELSCERDVQMLNAVLQSSDSMMVKGEPSEKMEKLFNHRLKEQRNVLAFRRVSPSKVPDDVLLASRRVERADRKRVPVEHGHEKPKRRRLVDGLGIDGQSDSTFQPHPAQPSKTGQTPKNRRADAQDQHNTPDELSLTPLESYLQRHSLRSRKEGGSVFRKPTGSPPQGFEPEIQRYSRTQDMGKPWVKSLVFPKEGKKRTTVEWDDLERLDEGEFLNDNLVAFYLRYLEHQAEERDPSISRKVYVFNTFFYERLKNTEPGHKGINYQAVKKWTRGVDLFTYDFVIVPVNEAYHWYVAIICNLPALSRKLGGFGAGFGKDDISASEDDAEQPAEDRMLFSSSPKRTSDDAEENETAASFAEMSLDSSNEVGDKDARREFQKNSTLGSRDQDALDNQLRDPVEEANDADEKPALSKVKKGRRKSGPSPRKFDPNKPTILTFDSFGTTHATAIRALKSYLHEEANDKRGQMEFDEKDLQGVTAKDIPLQSNFYDCGLYILGYIEKFFDNPRDFVDKVMKHEWNLDKDWPNLNPSVMRAKMRNLLMDLYAKQQRDSIKVKRSKTTSKHPNGPISDRATDGKSPSSKADGEGKTGGSPSRAGQGEDQRTVPSNTDVPEPAQNINADPRELPATEPNSVEQSKADRQPLAEIDPPPVAPHEEHPRSFIVLDSQSQQVNATTLADNPNRPDPLAISIDLPSTIPDSQATEVAEISLRDSRQISPPSPRKSKGRRIDSFSSPPPAPKDAHEFPPAVPKSSHTADTDSNEGKSRGRKRTSGGSSKPNITGTDPKVVINID